jgi:hypothetical protein
MRGGDVKYIAREEVVNHKRKSLFLAVGYKTA